MTWPARTLISHGFTDLEKSQRFLDSAELDQIDRQELLQRLKVCANVDLTLQSIVRLWDIPEVRTLIFAEQGEALLRVLGASEALADFMLRVPEAVQDLAHGADLQPRNATELEAALHRAVQQKLADPEEATVLLRRAYRRELLRIAARDVSSEDPHEEFSSVSAELADLAGATLDVALEIAREMAKAHFDPADIEQVHVAIIGMGKTGARELNYISDVDVIYVLQADQLDAELASKIGSQLARSLSKIISSPGAEPGLWEVDANLRPEGKDGPLVRTLDSHLNYYERWASNWEFQALVKARCIAGDRALGQRYEQGIAPMIWSSAHRQGFVESVQAMRRRVTDHIPQADQERQIKLGSGGLRDVEFTVQLLQLVHGRVDETLRVRSTVDGIQALYAGGYMSSKDAASMEKSYRYLRVLEHRIQMEQMRRTHLMPIHEWQRRALARAIAPANDLSRPTPESLVKKWQKVRRTIGALHESIFYRPLLATAANLSEDDVRLSPESAKERLAALGFMDPAGAMRHIEALTKGISRRALIQRQLLPAMMDYMAEAVNPDQSMLAFRKLSEALGESPWYLSMLRDAPNAAQNVCRILASGSMLTDMLEANAQAASWIGNVKELEPVPFAEQWSQIKHKMARHHSSDHAMRLIRMQRQREILRTAMADALGRLEQQDVGTALADADRAAILGALRIAERDIYNGEEPLTDVVVVAMGRQGGAEIGYGSDADVLYVHQPRPGAEPDAAQKQAENLVHRLGTLLQQPVKPAVIAERVLTLDADLRPEGKQGAMVRTVESYAQYYQRWGETWEAQALLRAKPIAGSDEVAEQFMVVIDPIRYPEPRAEHARREVVRVKARVEAERLPRGADATRHLKLGRGGLSDVEWLVQLMQMEHAGEHPQLRTPSTLAALAELGNLELLSDTDAQVLKRAWLLASRIRSGIVVWSGRASDSLPSRREDLEALARWCGYEPGHAAQFEEDYLRTTRQARAVFEKHFYA